MGAAAVSVSDEEAGRFGAGIRTEAVRFVIDDAVRVTSGKNKGRAGAVISLFSLDPVTTYLIEPTEEPWGDFQAAQSDLELTE